MKIIYFLWAYVQATRKISTEFFLFTVERSAHTINTIIIAWNIEYQNMSFTEQNFVCWLMNYKQNIA